MDLSFLEEIEAEEKRLSEMRCEARRQVLAEIQRLIDRIGAKPAELRFPAPPRSRSSKRRKDRKAPSAPKSESHAV